MSDTVDLDGLTEGLITLWIAVEGADGVGKTTFVSKLQTLLEEYEASTEGDGRPVIVKHHGKPYAHPLVEYEQEYEAYEPTDAHIISDRLHFGELLYGPLYRGNSNIDGPMWLHIDKFFQSRGGVMILLDHDRDVILNRWKERGEDFLQEEHLDFVLDGYRMIRDASCLDITTLRDPTDQEVTAVALMGFLREAEAINLRKFSTYVGPAYPKYLLFGETRKNIEYGSAFVPYPATSGHFLLDNMPSDMQREFGLANAMEENTLELWNLLGKPSVVALGKVADKKLTKEGVPHHAVPHPQFVRRFHNKRGREYVSAIAHALQGEPVTFP